MAYFDDLENHTAATLLVVDDEPHMRSFLVRALRLAGHAVEEASSGQEALMLLEHKCFELMILDMRLPGITGLKVMQEAGRLCPDQLIIVLTGHATLESAIAAVKSEEVVDYLRKPVNNREIIDTVARALRIRSERLRHRHLFDMISQIFDVSLKSEATSKSKQVTGSSSPPREAIIAPPLILNPKKRIVTVENEPPRIIELTKGETAVLSCLMSQAGRVISCEELVSKSWGYEVDENEAQSIIRPYIQRLRQKLEVDPKEPQLICTVRRQGYRLSTTDLLQESSGASQN